MDKSNGSVVVPGDKLGDYAANLVIGSGVYAVGNHIFASVLGTLKVENNHISIVRRKDRLSPAVPETNSIVLAKITSINTRSAKASILSVGDKPVMEPFPGMIRVHDIRSANVDDIQMANCFRPGDIVRARVISLGDSRSYFLSTARADLGVVYASRDGVPMAVVNGESMKCQKANISERRKVAIL